MRFMTSGVLTAIVLAHWGGQSALGGEFQAGYSRLLMSDDETGHQVWYGYRQRSSRKISAGARVDLLNRSGLSEGRLSPAASYTWGGVHTLTGELGIAPGARIFPQAGGSLEYSRPIAQGMAGALTSIYAQYSASRNLGLAGRVEYYFPGNWAVVGRVAVARESTDLDPGASYHPSVLAKFLRFFNDDDRAWVHVGKGVEGGDTAGSVSAGSVPTFNWGFGGAKYFGAGQSAGAWGVEANVDWQERESHLSRMVTLTLALNHRW